MKIWIGLLVLVPSLASAQLLPRHLNAADVRTAFVNDSGTNPTWYNPSTVRLYAPQAVASQAYGYGNQAQTLGIYTNQSQLQVDRGCALGGFGEHYESRSYDAGTDQVGECQLFTMALPIATLNYAAAGATDVTFVPDSAVSVQQFTTASFGAAPLYTGAPSQQTKLLFTTALTPPQIAALQVNTFVQLSTGWTGLVKAWDPAGTWITVDTWASIIVSGTTAYVGYDPRALNIAPTGALQTSLTVTIGANNSGYGKNFIMTMPSGVYCLFGNGCQMEGIEGTMVNNGRGFVRTNEYNWFQDNPRNIGMLLGASGLYGNSTGYAVAGGQFDKSFVAGEGQLAGFLAEPFGDYAMGAGFMSHQVTGVAFAAKNATLKDYTYQVDAPTGTVQQGGQGPLVSTVRGTVAVQSSGGNILDLTKDGTAAAATGSNLPVFIPPSSSVDLVARLQASNAGDGNRQITLEVECVYSRVGSAAPTLTGAAISPKISIPAASNSYTEACDVDGTNSYGKLRVQQTTGTVTNWIASYTATINPR